MSSEKLAENLLEFVPFLHKKLFKGFDSTEIPKQQIQLLFFINCENGKPMKYYREKMMIAKPNLTVIAEKLIEEGYVERDFDPNDRRIIILKITKKGEDCVHRQKKLAVQEIIRKIEPLEFNDIKRLNDMFEEIEDIFKKLD